MGASHAFPWSGLSLHGVTLIVSFSWQGAAGTVSAWSPHTRTGAMYGAMKGHATLCPHIIIIDSNNNPGLDTMA